MRTLSIHQIGIPAFLIDVVDNQQFRIADVNAADCAIFDVNAEDVVGKMIADCVPQDVFEQIYPRYSECMLRREITQYDEMLEISGKETWWRTTLTPILGDVGQVVQMFGIAVEITERKHLEAALLDAANRDPLTGVANRRCLETVVADAMSEAVYSNRIFGMIVIDLDGFKAVNDEFGHRKGDEILCHVALLLSRAARDNEIVARIGGDEFAMKVTAGSEIELAAVVDALRHRFVEDSVETCHWATVGWSIGGALWRPGLSFDDLLSDADERMYSDKILRRGGREMARDELDEFVGTRIRELRKSRGMSLQSLGSMTGVAYQQCQKYENGTNRISASQLWRVSKALGVPVDAFFPDGDLDLVVAAQLARIPLPVRTAISELIEVVASARTQAPAPASPPPSSSA